MTHGRLRNMAVITLASLLIAGLMATANAQEETKPADDAAPAAKKERSKPRGRLPAYFSSVVSFDQRSKIYAIQSRYADQIQKLQDQIVQLMSQREVDVQEVLTPAQLEEVSRLREAARARRGKSKPAATKPKAETPAATPDDKDAE